VRGEAPSVPLPTTLLHFTALLLHLFNRQSTNFQIISIPFQTISPPPTIVGYNTQTLTAGKYNLISLPFAGVAGGNSKLTDAMSGANWQGGETFNDGDQIQVWGYNDKGIGGYTIYYYYADPSDPTWDGWYDASGSYYFDDCEENVGGLEPGWNAWYLSRGNSNPTVTMAGAIASEDDVSFTVYGGGYSLLSNPFPIRLKLNDKTQVDWGAIHGGETFNDGDQIQVWGFNDKGIGGYSIYYYYADSSDPQWDGWYDASGSYYFEDVPETDNANGLKAGEPFWYLSRDTKGTNHTVKFLNPTK